MAPLSALRYRVWYEAKTEKLTNGDFGADRISIPPVIPAHGDVVKTEIQGRALFALIEKHKKLNLWLEGAKGAASIDPDLIFVFLSQKDRKTSLALSISLLEDVIVACAAGPRGGGCQVTQAVLASIDLGRVKVQTFVPMTLKQQGHHRTAWPQSGYLATLEVERAVLS